MGKQLQTGPDERNSSEGHGSDGSSGSVEDLVFIGHRGASSQAGDED